MTKTCPNCGKKNPDNSEFCKNCGNDIKSVAAVKASKSGVGGWWSEQTTIVKALSVVGICCLGLIVIFGISAILSPDSNTSTTTTNTSTTPATTTPTTTTTSTTSEPTTVTITQLYGTSIAEGTKVKVTGTVLQSDGYSLRIENSDGKDILVEGYGLNAYEDQSVTVVGTYEGPTSYTTVLGSERTVPHITNAEIV